MRKYIVARKNIVSVVLVLAMVIASIVCVAPKTVEAASAKRKINKTAVSVDIGKTYTLKILKWRKMEFYDDMIWATDNDVSVKWSTSNKKIATVSSKGKVTGKKAGTCTVTAKVGSKSFKCKITVKRPVSKDLLEIKSVATAKNYYCGAAYRIKNTNDYTVQFDFSVNYYDEKGKFIATCVMGMFVIGSGETVYLTANGPDNGYDTAKPVIKELKKSEYKSAVKDIEITLNDAEKSITVTNNGDFTITRLLIDCWFINENKQVEMVVLFGTTEFSENGLKPGKSYTCDLGTAKNGDRFVIMEASDRVVNTITVN